MNEAMLASLDLIYWTPGTVRALSGPLVAATFLVHSNYSSLSSVVADATKMHGCSSNTAKRLGFMGRIGDQYERPLPEVQKKNVGMARSRQGQLCTGH